MDRRTFIQSSIGGVTALTSLAAAETPIEVKAQTGTGDSASRPNILFIMTDQQRYDCVGANGNPIIQTPNLDRLAAESANFSHCYVQSPVCVPSRACFFTGRYAHSHQNRVNYTPLAANEVLMQRRLQDAGYQTCLVGKTHLYYEFPPTREQAMRTGFDVVDLHDGAKATDAWSDYVAWRNANDPRKDVYYRDVVGGTEEGNPLRCHIQEQYTDTTWTGLKTREHLQRLAQSEKPFFLFSSYWKPHSPYEVPEPFDSLYSDVDIPLPKPETLAEIERLPVPLQKLILRSAKPEYDMSPERLQWIYRSYYGSVTHIDREVGLTLGLLAELGLAENTIVIFCSDHGDQLLEHGLTGKNVFFEASVRVPFMIRYPGRIAPAACPQLVESVDVLPTLFDLVGLPEPYTCQGRSFAALLKGEAGYQERDAVFSENIIPEVFSSTYHFEKGKGIKGVRHPDAKMVRTLDWKYCYYPEGFAELYSMRDDPLEQNNLAGNPTFSGVERELRDRILHWLITSQEADQIAPKWLV